MDDDQGFVFDKFIDDIVAREDRERAIKEKAERGALGDSPWREHNRLHRELPQNRTRIAR